MFVLAKTVANSLSHLYKGVTSQSYPLGSIVKYAQGTKKISVYLRKNRAYTLWRPQSFPFFLQEFCNSSLSPSFCSMAQLLSSGVPSGRPFPGSRLLHCSWHRSHREHSMPHTQWLDTSAAGLEQFPASGHPEGVSSSFWGERASKSADCTRQIADRTLSSMWASIQCHRRCRHYQLDHLRIAGRYRPRLYRQTALHAIFLRTNHFQRRSNRFYARHGTETGQCPCRYGNYRFPATYSAKAPYDDCRHAHSCTTRRCFLRQSHHRTLAGSTFGLCGGRQHVPAFEKKDGDSPISRVPKWLGGRRVYLHSFQLEEEASLCGRAQACGFGIPGDSKTFVYLQALHLPPRVGNQPGIDSSSGLALLLRSRFSRTAAAGIQRFLYDGKDSYAQLLGQRCLYGNDSLGIRLGAEFSVFLFASRGSTLEYFNPAQRTLVGSRRMGEKTQSQFVDFAKEVSSARSFSQNPERGV
jgi:hypothetical protein